MKKLFSFAITAMTLMVITPLTAMSETYGDYPIQGVPFSKVTLTDQFWAPRIEQNRSVTIPIALQQCETTGPPTTPSTTPTSTRFSKAWPTSMPPTPLRN